MRTPGIVHAVDIDGPNADLAVPPAARQVLLVVRHRGAVVAQPRIPATPIVDAATLHAAAGAAAAATLGDLAREERLAQALGAPPPEAWATRRHTVSVAVLHAGPAAQLDAALRAIGALRRPPDEVLAVDPRHDPAAAAVCARHDVRHLLAPFLDVGAARALAVRAAAGELLAATESSAIVDPGWLDGIDAAFADLRTAAVTGHVGPQPATGTVVDLPDPADLPPVHARGLALTDPRAPLARLLRDGPAANLVLRRRPPGWPLWFPAALESSPDGVTEQLALERLLAAGWRLRHDPAQIVWRAATGAPGPRARAKRVRAKLRARAATVRRRAQRRASHPAPHAGADSGPRVAVFRDAAPVTLAIASHQRRDELNRILRGLGAQTQPAERFEVVVVLDGSTDGSAEMVRGLDVSYRLRLITQDRRGLAAARNAGVRAARHPLVVFCDDDIEPVPGFLAAHASAHASAGREAFVIGYTPPVVGDGWFDRWLRGWWLEHFSRLAEPDHRVGLHDVNDGNASVPVSLWTRIGGFDESFSGRRQDHDLGARLLDAGVPIVFARDAVALHHLRKRPADIVRESWEEGRADARLAARHPARACELTYALPGWRETVGRLRIGARPLQPAMLGIVGALDAGPTSHAAERMLAAACLAAYADGARTGIREFGAPDARAAAAGLQPVSVDLDVVAAPPFDARALLLLRCGDVRTAAVRAAEPGRQFGWADLIARAHSALC